MPLVTIDVRRAYPPAEEVQIIDAVHAALVAGLQTPESDKNIRLVVHEPHRFAAPPGTSDRYMIISIDLFAGRSVEAKRQFYQALASGLGALGIPTAEIVTVLREPPLENWGLNGDVAGVNGCAVSLATIP